MATYINRKNSYVIFLVINIVMALIRLFIFPHQTVLFHISIFIGALSLFILGWEILLIMHRTFEPLLPIASKPVLRTIVQILLTTIIFTIFSKALFITGSKVFGIEISPLLDTVLYLLNFMIAIIFNLVLFGTEYFYKWKTDLISKTNLEREQALVRYDALRNQLNPHFLFNALTSLNSLIFANQQLASDFLQQLSKVYRYILQHKEKETVSLRTELDFVQNFISLLKTRFTSSIDIQIDVKDEDMDKGIVPVLTQILIENAVKHNVISKDYPLQIQISTEDNFLVVRNTVIRKTQVETSNKLGMENLKALYKYLSTEDVRITTTEHQFIVHVPLL